MPDLDLRDALHDLSNDVALVDVLPRVETRLVARRRYRTISAGVATLLVIAGTVAAVTATRQQHGGSLPPVSPRPSTSAPAPTGALSSESVLPSWLPAGVTLAGQDELQPSARTNPDWKAAPHSWYRIDGPANADTIPPGGPTAENATTVHPDTTIDISFNPNVRTMPPVPTQPRYFIRRTITIAGNPALVSTPKNGYGAFRIDWVDPAGYHAIMCDRLKTPEGRSGVPMRDLIHMARSLYSTAPSRLSQRSPQITEVGLTVGYLPSGFQPVVDEAPDVSRPAGMTQLVFQDNEATGARRSLTVELWRVDHVSDAATFADDNGHLRITQIGGHNGAVGWNVPQHEGPNDLHLAYVAVGPGVAIQVTEIDSADAKSLSDAELIRIAASVHIN